MVLRSLARCLWFQLTTIGHVEIIHQVLDEIREDFEWALQNDRFGARRCDEWRPVTHITSMPKDPCAQDFGERLNRYSAADIPDESMAPPPTKSDPQGSLFE